jgi:hypothetical protein
MRHEQKQASVWLCGWSLRHYYLLRTAVVVGGTADGTADGT